MHRQGIDAIILEARSREYVEARIRAGLLEQGTMEVLREAGVGERMDAEGLVHGGIYLCFDHTRHHIPMRELTNGRTMMIYGQTEVVKDLIAARLEAELPLLFECDGVTVEGLDHDEPVVHYRYEGAEHELRCDIVAGCDGFHGVCRPTIPEDAITLWGREYPYAWLGILADVAPSTDELIYAYSDRGFALHTMRSLTRSRLYIQVDPEDNVENWSDDRIWSELHQRLASDGWELQEGPIVDKSITPMRSFVAAPMRYRSLLLAGDAAHIVPPTGAKGLNLAVADVTVLADALVAHFSTGSETGLDEYSDRCLTRVWRAQHFSWFMTTMLHLSPHDDAFGRELQRSQLRYVTTSTAAATSLAENYVGLPLEQTAPPAVTR
ncbi:MAG: 4-hydroxybenzoate 3-monooxygenase [Solirubrobacteraceae bacterium]